VISTRITEMFDLQYPIMSAPMALHSGGTLAAAVSIAGGLGTFGGLQPFAGPQWVDKQARLVRQGTDRPFGVGFISAFLPMFPQFFDVAIEAKVPVIALSFGGLQPWLERAKASGATVICQVQTIEHAQQAVLAGADVLVAQGNEAGGHTGRMNLLPFLTHIVDLFPSTPVMAAGGIADGRALAACLAAGADGAWLGTAFLATPEAVEISDGYKDAIVQSNGEDTVYTKVFDIVQGLPWPEGIAGRVRRNRFTHKWHGREDEVRAKREQLAPVLMAAEQQHDIEQSAIYMGQSAAFVKQVRPAADVMRNICEDAERILRERPAAILG
jgi:nitronate monooxygenase